MSETLERWIHLNMCFIGGFIGGFAILNHSDLFGSAQTANMITIVMGLAGRNPVDLLFRIGGILLYILGLASTVVLPHYCKINMKLISIFVDIIAVTAIAVLPHDLPHFVALYPVFLAMPIQWCSFKGAEGYAASSIFSTNNLRQCVTGYTGYICTKDTEALRRGKLYAKVLFSFHLGVLCSYLSCIRFGVYGVWICMLPLILALTLVLIEEKRVSVWRVRLWLGWKMLHPIH